MKRSVGLIAEISALLGIAAVLGGAALAYLDRLLPGLLLVLAGLLLWVFMEVAQARDSLEDIHVEVEKSREVLQQMAKELKELRQDLWNLTLK
ncbi:MAG: hypothetical protein GWN84_08860 [Gammaproteobacteria bacterium]|nr:hypothetical protein [Gammaproteobacteria bacterium]NIR83849.1 hypothetical protein [Gammaproteobacteria bacterium]NIU04149.1 hypothetical protein [Gammaproteobacteria bacterium]NIX85423.1 hypothetical protein [Gammaproteobacteria bacterium]